MSRRSRRNAVVISGVPEIIGRPFDDSDVGEPFEPRSSYEEQRGVPLYRDSPQFPVYRRPPLVLPLRSPLRGYGGRKLPISAVRRQAGPVRAGLPSLPSKGISAYERRGVLFNRVVPAFSKRVDFCVKRKQRREVIFAVKKSGRNGAKVYRRTYASSYRC